MPKNSEVLATATAQLVAHGRRALPKLSRERIVPASTFTWWADDYSGAIYAYLDTSQRVRINVHTTRPPGVDEITYAHEAAITSYVVGGFVTICRRECAASTWPNAIEHNVRTGVSTPVLLLTLQPEIYAAGDRYMIGRCEPHDVIAAEGTVTITDHAAASTHPRRRYDRLGGEFRGGGRIRRATAAKVAKAAEVAVRLWLNDETRRRAA